MVCGEGRAQPALRGQGRALRVGEAVVRGWDRALVAPLGGSVYVGGAAGTSRHLNAPGCTAEPEQGWGLGGPVPTPPVT